MVLDFKEISKEEAMFKFNQILNETIANQESLDIVIETGSNYEVSGSLLEMIDDLELDHQIRLGGVIEVTLE